MRKVLAIRLGAAMVTSAGQAMAAPPAEFGHHRPTARSYGAVTALEYVTMSTPETL